MIQLKTKYVSKCTRRTSVRALGRRHTQKPVDHIASQIHTRKIPSYQFLADNALQALEDQADWLLENVGIEFKADKTALELFTNAGAKNDGERGHHENNRNFCL